MNLVVLDGEKISSMVDVHNLFANELKFPSFYGRNLDALYDCLTDINEKTVIEVRNFEQLEYEIGKYSSIILRVLRDASEVNDNLEIIIDE